MSVPKNPNKRTKDDKQKQREEGCESNKHGTAKERARARNRLRAARKRGLPHQEGDVSMNKVGAWIDRGCLLVRTTVDNLTAGIVFKPGSADNGRHGWFAINAKSDLLGSGREKSRDVAAANAGV